MLNFVLDATRSTLGKGWFRKYRGEFNKDPHALRHRLYRIWKCKKLTVPTLDVWVLRLDSVANPFPQMLQWKGLFFARSTCASWLRRCCCRLLSWMKARPHSGRWHLYGLSPARTRILYKWQKYKANGIETYFLPNIVTFTK